MPDVAMELREFTCKRCKKVLAVVTDTEMYPRVVDASSVPAGPAVKHKIDLYCECGYRSRWFPLGRPAG